MRARLLPLLVVCLPVICLLVVCPVTAPLEAKPRLPAKTARKLQELAKRWFQARPKTKFEAWDRAKREGLLAAAAALGEMPEGTREAVIDILWKSVRKYGPRAPKDEIETPYGTATWIANGKGRKKAGLILGLHGGGPGAGSAGEATKWKLPGHVGFYPQGIRLIHDTWSSVHGERFVLTMIEIAKAQHGVDPDRVYAMGFSMGGNGSMALAGRHPDLFAGAIPAHGVVAAKPHSKIVDPKDVVEVEHGIVPNLRNVAVYFYTGSEDRNCEPGTFGKAWSMIEELRSLDPGGYQDIRFRCHPNVAHAFPPGEPGKGYAFIEEKRRNAHPEKIVWEYNEDPWPYPDGDDEGKATRWHKHWMYWLYCLAPRDRMLVTATRSKTEEGNVFDITFTKVFQDDFTIYMDERTIDPAKPVIVQVAGKEVWRGTPKPTYATVLESLDARLDRTLAYDRKIRVPEPD
jgi:predicted esterase